MLGKVRLLWIRAWIKQDKLWMEQGHARGFAFTAVAAALSGCSGMSPQVWTGTILALRDRLDKRGQDMGLLWTGTQSRNLAGFGHRVCLGTESGAANGRNSSMACSAQPQAGREQTAEPKPSPAWVLGQQGEPLCSPGALLAAALLGKWHCHIWMCHHQPGSHQGQH